MAVRKTTTAEEEEFRSRALPFKRKDRGPLEAHHIKFYRDDWQVLQEHFKEMGVSTAGGIRSVLWRYMKDKEL